jgi:hypothetical protein
VKALCKHSASQLRALTLDERRAHAAKRQRPLLREFVVSVEENGYRERQLKEMVMVRWLFQKILQITDYIAARLYDEPAALGPEPARAAFKCIRLTWSLCIMH